MKSTTSIILIALTALFVFTGCNKDKEAPTVTVTSPAEHSEFHAMDEVHLEATLADDKELASYSLMIGDVDGEHIHGFHHDESGNASGTEQELHTMITIPDSAGVSMFFVHITATDAEGKTGSASHMLHIH